ncbi:MAG TPA: hypothetical protein PK335_01380 [Draconibacterium sp.]|nr:hypothetical protein [Draconibacterium sp.]
MKATVKQIATITFTALFLIALNVKAEGTENTALNNENIETALKLENWMTDETIWNTNSAMFIEIAPETELGLEEWMINSESWNIYFNIEEETEAGLELEAWMTSDFTWNSNLIETEPELKLEYWMMDKNIWK